MKRLAVVAVVAAALAAIPLAARAQVIFFPSPVPVASICQTPLGWCGMLQPLPVGSACVCAGPGGWVNGVAR
jgi:hypothetical protein